MKTSHLTIMLLLIVAFIVVVTRSDWTCLEEQTVPIKEIIKTKCDNFLGLVYWNCTSYKAAGNFIGQTCSREGIYCVNETSCLVVRTLGQYIKIKEIV